ncbi:ATP-binding response regulator [Haladaptatus paucihalophilus]|uniref:histidine kinase n=1 Tax=Haladaptatus paucihalophilus DX253 TaxID=797209 RepID=A0A1M6WGM3_HALPU|nr:ATP-binding protein [Haladaptatus paucihalophilus]SHK92867.1 PAS domain S-box-containing protein [Haladaptatus paucihalophilus DX253]
MANVDPVSIGHDFPAAFRVLHVDTDEDFLRLARETLEREDDIEDVIGVTNADDAVEWLFERDVDIDCLVTEYELRDGSGLELLETVRERRPYFPFIVFTGTGSEDVASHAISAGATNYLQKGTSGARFVTLASQITQAVSHRHVEKQVHRGFRAIDTTREGIALLTDDFRFNYVNDAYANLFEYDAETLIGRNWATTLTDDAVATLSSEVVSTVDAAGEWSGEITGERKDGRTLALTLTISAAPDDEYVCAVRDVTERKEREKALVRENERLDEFASQVSHDLRGPLSIVYGYLDLARKTGESEHFDEIERAANRIEAIISDLLEIAREGQKTLKLETVVLDEFAADVWDGIESESATVDTGPADGRLLADRDRLTELFANLFRNAVEHGGDDVTVSVGSTCDGFYVADDGHGIPDEHRKQVLQSGYSTEEVGTGLGLSIVQQIADSHGWSLSIDESDAGGARFSFTGVERPDAS